MQSVLVESYTYAPFRERVEGTRDLCRAVVEFAAREGKKLVLGRAVKRGEEVAIRSALASHGKTTLKGWKEVTENGRTKPTTEPMDYDVELMDRFDATLSVDAPAGYLVPAELTGVIEKLRQHGVRMRAVKGGSAPAQAYTVEKVESASRLFQKHAIVKVEAARMPVEIIAREGDVFVPVDAEVLGRLAVYLLEPMCEDGLTTWNFLDAWTKVGSEFPIKRVLNADALLFAPE
jgi:hypothetical protein